MNDENKSTEETKEALDKKSKEETVEETQPAPETKPEETISEEKKGEAEEKSDEEKKEGETEPKKEPEDVVEKETEIKEDQSLPEQPKKDEPVKGKPKIETKEAPEKKDVREDDFKYIVRIANTDIDGNKKVVHGLTQIKGIGWHMAVLVADAAGMDRKIKIGDLTDTQIEKIKEVLDNLDKTAPSWMLNHRKDYDTGKDFHLISSDVDLRLRDNINLLKMVRSYRGIRHEMGLAVRGQRTRANGRRGLAIGVSRKRVSQQSKK